MKGLNNYCNNGSNDEAIKSPSGSRVQTKRPRKGSDGLNLLTVDNLRPTALLSLKPYTCLLLIHEDVLGPGKRRGSKSKYPARAVRGERYFAAWFLN